MIVVILKCLGPLALWLHQKVCSTFHLFAAILVIFLTRALDYTENDAVAIYHGFNMADYFTPLFGALLADGYLGHYKYIC